MRDEIVISQEELDLPNGRSESGGTAYATQVKRGFNWKRFFKYLAVVVGVIIVAVVAFVMFNLFKVTGNPFSFGALKGERDGRVNIMLLGVGDPGHAGENLSDTNIILSIDTRNNQVAIISIPRDLRVKIPEYGYSKINNAHAQGGVKGAKQVYEESFGVPIHYYVKANFSGLKQVVDAVGGVDVENKTMLYDPEYPCDNNQYRACGFKLAAGKHHLDGKTALKYVRCRKGTCGDDFGRAERQQQVMESIRSRATSAGVVANPVALGKLVDAAGKNIETDLSVNNLLRLNQLTKDADPSKVIRIVFNIEPGGFLVSSGTSSDLVPEAGDFSEIKAFVKEVFKYGPIWMERPNIIVENGTTTPGIAAAFQEKLEEDSYTLNILALTNALQRNHQTSQIIDYTNGKKPNSSSYLQGLLKVQPAPPAKVVNTSPADFVIILGADFASTIKDTSSSGSSASGSSTRKSSSAITR